MKSPISHTVSILATAALCIVHCALCVLHFAFCIPVSAAPAGNTDAVAVNDMPSLPGEPILRWWGRDKRKFYRVPADNPGRIFARVVMGEKQPQESVLAFSIEKRETYFPVKDTFIIDAKGLYPRLGYPKNAGNGATPIKPGETSAWVEITDTLLYGYNCLFSAKAQTPKTRDLPATVVPDFKVQFSRDGETVCGEIANYGGKIAVGLVSRARGTVIDDKGISEADVARALEDLGPAPAKRPRRFAVHLAHAVVPWMMSPPAYSNEVKVLGMLGPNSLMSHIDKLLDPGHEHEPDYLYRRPPGSHMFTRHKGHICSPDYAGMTNQLVQLVNENRGELARGKKIIVNTADEPHYYLSSLASCQSREKTCRERYGRDFVFNPANGLDDYFETVAYRDKIVCDFYKAMTAAARALDTNLLCAANIGISLVVGGNAEDPGSDPFVMADAKSLGIGQTEDWCNLQRTRQFTSYMCDVYRAAYGRNGMNFEMCSILLSPPETEAKIFTEVGHGAKAIYLYKYGPHWVTGDASNRRRGIFPAIRHACEAIAEAEDAIVDATVARGDVALLYSLSCDKLQMADAWKRNRIERNPYGKDRMSTHLLLLHCGVRADILDEKDILRLLGDYRVLFVTDRNINRDAARALVDWMRNGGVVVKTAGALVADERDTPYPEGFFANAGRIVELDFSPWTHYVKPAKQMDDCSSHRAFDEAVRMKMADAVREAGVTRRVFTDNPLIEASLLENGGKSVIALSNWTTNAHPCVSVTLENAPAGKVRSASGAEVTASRNGDRLEASLDIGWGDYLILE